MSQQSVLDVQDLYVTFHQDKKAASCPVFTSSLLNFPNAPK